MPVVSDPSHAAAAAGAASAPAAIPWTGGDTLSEVTGKSGTVARRFDIRAVPTARRRDALVGALDSVYYPCDFAFSTPDVVAGAVRVVDFGPVQAGRVRLDPVYVERTPRQISRRSGDFVFVPMPLAAGPGQNQGQGGVQGGGSRLRLRQRGREADADGTQFAFAASADAYAYMHDCEIDAVTVRIEAAEVRSRVPHFEDLTATAFRGEGNAAALFMDYARSFCLNAASLDGQAGAVAARHLLDLFAMALLSGDSGAGGTESAVREANRQRILRHVETRLGDPELGTASVSRALGLSERYIQKLLAEHAETLSGVIRERRVAEAKRLLADPAMQCRSIATIAYQLGFSDPAYFSRVFREVTGASPRDYRNGSG